MLIRFTMKNLYSFNNETEFNVFPSKTQKHEHHKLNLNGIEALRLNAIYGANGSGKSNLIKAISLLKKMIIKGKVINDLDDVKFKLDSNNQNLPVSYGIELYAKSKIYYYTLTFDEHGILNEALYESLKKEDRLIFERSFEEEKQKIVFETEYMKNDKNKLFIDVLSEKLLKRNELLLSFLKENYKEEINEVDAIFNWFDETLVIINPNTRPDAIAHFLDVNKELGEFSNNFIKSINIGISKIGVFKKEIGESVGDSFNGQVKEVIDYVTNNPDKLRILRMNTGEEFAFSYENGKVMSKVLFTSHQDKLGNSIPFSTIMESDGTKRLIDYLPAINGIINEEKVYLIDEIERSIHPITIKEIIRKISLDTTVKGQLIFTTHESCLLDQDILRPDEIWFAQKDIDGSSRLYSLSDFNVHHTASIENGYLNGRYGGIPFLSNLKDLNWHTHEVS